MKLNPGLFSAILAVDPANIKSKTDPVNKNDTVLGILPAELIQFWGYLDALINEANDKLSLLKDRLEQLSDKHKKDHAEGIPSDECCSTYRSQTKTLLDKVKKVNYSAEGYMNFFWLLVCEHFELNKEECGNLAIRENWQIVQISPTSSIVESILANFFGGAFSFSFGGPSDDNEEKPSVEKTPTGDNPEFSGVRKPCWKHN